MTRDFAVFCGNRKPVYVDDIFYITRWNKTIVFYLRTGLKAKWKFNKKKTAKKYYKQIIMYIGNIK